MRAAVANQGGDIASAATTSIGVATGQYVRVTGTTAIAAFGTVNAGVMRWVEFTGALTLTHNAASLRLPGASNIVTAAGDVGLFVSLGAGNWKCLHYSRADGSAVAGFGGTLGSADAGAAEGPDFIADRASASPAAADIIGAFVMRGRDSGGGAADYAKLKGKILDATNGSEDGAGILSALVVGADTPVITFGPGVQIGAPAGGDPGIGKVNAAGYHLNGTDISHGVVQTAVVVSTTSESTTSAIPSDNTKPQIAEGKQFFSQAFTPKSAASTILIEVTMMVTPSSTGVNLTIALFDGNPDAVAVGCSDPNASSPSSISLVYAGASGGTSTRTYSVRYGPESGTMYVNREIAGNIYSGTLTSMLKITEFL